MMRPVPTRVTDSNQDLAEAMARLNTTAQVIHDGFETRDPTNVEPVCHSSRHFLLPYLLSVSAKHPRAVDGYGRKQGAGA